MKQTHVILKNAYFIPGCFYPLGTIAEWNNSINPPTGWVFCDGSRSYFDNQRERQVVPDLRSQEVNGKALVMWIGRSAQ